MIVVGILFILCAAISTIAGASLISDARKALRARREAAAPSVTRVITLPEDIPTRRL